MPARPPGAAGLGKPIVLPPALLAALTQAQQPQPQGLPFMPTTAGRPNIGAAP